MSGIVGSKFNIRGSGLVGSLGTDGQHMLSAGAGKTNVFETVSAGGGWVHLATQIISSVDLCEFDTDDGITSSYDCYKILINNLHMETDGDPPNNFVMQMKTAGSYVTSGYGYGTDGLFISQSAHIVTYSTSAAHIRFTKDSTGAASGETTNWEVTLWSPLDTDNTKMITFVGTVINQDGAAAARSDHGVGISNFATAIEAVKFFPTVDGFDSGTFSLYGLALA